MTEKGMRASVYTNPRYVQCAGVGLSQHVEDVTIVGIRDQRYPIPQTQWHVVKPLPREAQVSAATVDAPPVVVVYRNMGEREIVHVEPLMPNGERLWFMAGGSYVDSSDSRVADLKGFHGALNFHDRSEEDYGYATRLLDSLRGKAPA